MTDRTTFFTFRAAGQRVIKTGHRRGHWSRSALERLAARHGMALVAAYSIARSSKGWIPASRRDIVSEDVIPGASAAPEVDLSGYF